MKSLRRALQHRMDTPVVGVKANYIPPTAESIRQFRQLLGMTQVGFARQMNMSLQAYKFWEQKRRTPGPAMGARLRQLAQMNDIDLDLLKDKRYLQEMQVRVFGVEMTA